MKKKESGFTMVELLAVITIMGILSSIAVAGVTQYLNKAKKQDFEILEKNMKSGIDNYLVDHISGVPSIGNSFTKTAQELVDQGYLDGLEDPDHQGVQCDLNQSKITVTRESNSELGKYGEEDATTFNAKLNYKICVVCSKRKSKSC